MLICFYGYQMVLCCKLWVKEVFSERHSTFHDLTFCISLVYDSDLEDYKIMQPIL